MSDNAHEIGSPDGFTIALLVFYDAGEGKNRDFYSENSGHVIFNAHSEFNNGNDHREDTDRAAQVAYADPGLFLVKQRI